MRRIATLPLVLLFLTGCHACCENCSECAGPEGQEQPPAQGLQEGDAMSMQPVARGMQSGVRTSRQLVVRSADEWTTLWREHAGDRLPEEPVPAIVFEEWMVLAVVAGDRPTAGYEVQILRVERDGERLVVHTRETNPDPGLTQAQVVTSPFDFVAVPRFEGEVAFVAD